MPLVVAHRYTVWLEVTLTWLHNQIRLLPDDIESHVIVEKTSHPERFPVANLHVLAEAPRWRSLPDRVFRRIGARRGLRFVEREAARAGARLLHSHFGNLAWQDVPAARRLKVPHVVTFYGVDVVGTPRRDRRWYGRYREMFGSVAAVLCEGPHMGEAIEALGCPREKVRVHPLGIEIERFPYVARQWDGNGPFRVLIAGSFREKKGIPDAIEALGLLKARHPDLPLAVEIIGDAGADPAHQAEKRRIVEGVARHGLDATFRGYVGHDALTQAYYDNHVFLSPSVTANDGDTEGGMPVAILEACAAGIAVVSTTHCDIPRLCGVGTWLAPERSPEALAAHLDWLVTHADAWEKHTRAAHEHVVKGHDARVRALALAEIYRELT